MDKAKLDEIRTRIGHDYDGGMIAVTPEDRDALFAYIDQLERDKSRLDWLQVVKLANFRPRNGNLAISALELFTVPSQNVQSDTVRSVIDLAIARAGPDPRY